MSPPSPDKSKIVPGVQVEPQTHAEAVGRQFSLKVIEDDPHKAQLLGARLRKSSDVTMDAFLDIMEDKVDAHNSHWVYACKIIVKRSTGGLLA